MSTKKEASLWLGSSHVKANVLIVGWFAFGEESAGAKYVLGIAKALRAAGCDVTLAPCLEPVDAPYQNDLEFDGFRYKLLSRGVRMGKLKRFLQTHLALGDPVFDWLRNGAPKNTTHVLAYSGSCHFLWKLRKHCRLRNITLVNMIVEWYDVRHYNYLRPDRCFVSADAQAQRYFMNRLIPHTVCISRFLQEYYSRSGCLTLRVPPLLDVNIFNPAATGAVLSQDFRLRLMFLGSCRWGRQDLVLKAMKVLQERKRPVLLEYVGASERSVADADGSDGRLLVSVKDCVNTLGHVSAADARYLVKRADFGILLRDPCRWSQAGFPTKVPEFLASGVPMLCNLTSDLNEHLRDGENAIVVEEMSVGALTSAIERAISLSAEKRQAMRRSARREAEVSFDYRKYSRLLERFLCEGRAV